MSLTEQMILEIKAETQKAVSGMNRAARSSEKLGKEAKKAEQSTKGAFQSMRMGALAFVAAGAGAMRMIGGWIEAYQKQEMAEKKLSKALELSGNDVAGASDKWKEYASTLQSLTVVGDEVSIETMALALNMGITEDQLEGVTAAAIGLSQTFNMDLQQATRMVALAQQGNYTMLARYIPELRNATTEAEKAAITQETLRKAFLSANSETETSAGKIQQMSNEWGDFTETLGSIFAPVLTGTMQAFNNLVAEIKSGTETVGKVFSSLSKLDLKGAWGAITDGTEENARIKAGLNKVGDSAEDVSKKIKFGADETEKAGKKIGTSINDLIAMRQAAEAAVKETRDDTERAKEQKTVDELTAKINKMMGVERKRTTQVKVQKTEQEKLADIIQQNYDAAERGVLMKRLFGEVPIMSANAELQQIRLTLSGMGVQMAEIQEVAAQGIDWENLWRNDKIQETEEMLLSLEGTILQIGEAFGRGMFDEEGMKAPLKAALSLLIDYAQAQLLIASTVATLRTAFGDFGGWVAVGLGTALLQTAKAAVNEFRTGIDYVPSDAMPAILHKGEAVLTKEENQMRMQGQGSGGSDVVIHFSAFESVIQDSHVNRGRRYT